MQKIYRELDKDNEEYCRCLGNKVAIDFTKKPFMNMGYIENIKVSAANFCNDPQKSRKIIKGQLSLKKQSKLGELGLLVGNLLQTIIP